MVWLGPFGEQTWVALTRAIGGASASDVAELSGIGYKRTPGISGHLELETT